MKRESTAQSSASCSSTPCCEAKPPTRCLWRTQSVQKPQSIQRETRSLWHISTPQVALNWTVWAGSDNPLRKLAWESDHLSSYIVIYCYTLKMRPVHNAGLLLDTHSLLSNRANWLGIPGETQRNALGNVIDVCTYIHTHWDISLPVVCGQ